TDESAISDIYTLSLHDALPICCPVGIATQDKRRQTAIDVGDKSDRVARFHRNTMHALGEIAGAAGLAHPSDFMPYHFMFRQKDRSEEHTSELQSRENLVCRLLL